MAEEQIEITVEKSQELADSIIGLKFSLFTVDVDYAKAVIHSMRKQASFQDSAAVLNPLYMPEKSDLIRMQANMLEHLIQFIELGKEVDQMKGSIAQAEANRNNILKMFM